MFVDSIALSKGSTVAGSGVEGVRSVSLLIGPEGDFTQAEVDEVVGAGAQAVSFGPRILRTETAAIYGLSILNHEIGRKMQTWL